MSSQLFHKTLEANEQFPIGTHLTGTASQFPLVFLTLSMECHATNAMDRTYPRGLIRRESVVNEHQLYVSNVVMLSLDEM